MIYKFLRYSDIKNIKKKNCDNKLLFGLSFN